MAEGQPIRTFQPVKFFESFRWLAEIQAKNRALKAEQEASKAAANFEAVKFASDQEHKKNRLNLDKDRLKLDRDKAAHEAWATEEELRIEEKRDLLNYNAKLKKSEADALEKANKDSAIKLTQKQVDTWAEDVVAEQDGEHRNAETQKILFGLQKLKQVQKQREKVDRINQKAEWEKENEGVENKEEFVYDRVPTTMSFMEDKIFLNDYTSLLEGDLNTIESFSDFVKLGYEEGALEEFIKTDPDIQNHIALAGVSHIDLNKANTRVDEFAKKQGLTPAQADRIKLALPDARQKREDERFPKIIDAEKRFDAKHSSEEGAKLRERIIEPYVYRTGNAPFNLDEDRKEFKEKSDKLDTLSKDLLNVNDLLGQLEDEFGKQGVQLLGSLLQKWSNQFQTFVGIKTTTTDARGNIIGTKNLSSREAMKVIQNMSEADMLRFSRQAFNKAAGESNVLSEIGKHSGNDSKHSAMITLLGELNTALGAVFTSFRQTITGAQASAKELEWLARTVFNTEGTYDQMRGQIDFWYVSTTATAKRFEIEAMINAKIDPRNVAGQRYVYEQVTETMREHANLFQYVTDDYIDRMIGRLSSRGFWAYRYLTPRQLENARNMMLPAEQKKALQQYRIRGGITNVPK